MPRRLVTIGQNLELPRERISLARKKKPDRNHDSRFSSRAVARKLIGGGGCIFIHSGSARLTSFEINFISKETSRAEPEYMNIHPPPN